MSTERRYTISCNKPGAPEKSVTGDYAFGPWDAAREYAKDHLPGFTALLPRYVKVQDTEKHGLHTLWRAEAYNHDEGVGTVIWIREL